MIIYLSLSDHSDYCCSVFVTEPKKFFLALPKPHFLLLGYYLKNCDNIKVIKKILKIKKIVLILFQY
jgi:hypothetical protein